MTTITQPGSTASATRKTVVQRTRGYFRKNGVFKDYKFNLGIWGSEWTGFNNFGYLFATRLTGRVLFNTLFMNALFIITSTTAGVILALLMNEVHHKLRARFYQSAMFFPSFISAVIISYFTLAFLSTSAGRPAG